MLNLEFLLFCKYGEWSLCVCHECLANATSANILGKRWLEIKTKQARIIIPIPHKRIPNMKRELIYALGYLTTLSLSLFTTSLPPFIFSTCTIHYTTWLTLCVNGGNRVGRRKGFHNEFVFAKMKKSIHFANILFRMIRENVFMSTIAYPPRFKFRSRCIVEFFTPFERNNYIFLSVDMEDWALRYYWGLFKWSWEIARNKSDQL